MAHTKLQQSAAAHPPGSNTAFTLQGTARSSTTICEKKPQMNSCFTHDAGMHTTEPALRCHARHGIAWACQQLVDASTLLAWPLMPRMREMNRASFLLRRGSSAGGRTLQLVREKPRRLVWRQPRISSPSATPLQTHAYLGPGSMWLFMLHGKQTTTNSDRVKG